MPLDLDSTNPMYLLGRVVAVIDIYTPRHLPRVAETGVLNTLLVRPATGLGLLSKKLGARMSDPAIEDILSILPEGGLPNGPIAVEAQGPYWMGYYHQREQGRRDTALTRQFNPDLVRRIGETLYGGTWQTEMARGLNIGDPSRVRAWLSDNPAARRRVPPGVCRDLLAMLRQRSAEARSLADEIDSQSTEDDD